MRLAGNGSVLFIRIINIIVCTCAGCYSTYLFYLLLIKQHAFSFTDLQSYVALVYLIALATLITAVEFRTLRHRDLIVLFFFLFFRVGMGFTLIFMGAVLLGALVWGWVVGGVLIGVGVLNIFIASCCTKKAPRDPVELQ